MCLIKKLYPEHRISQKLAQEWLLSHTKRRSTSLAIMDTQTEPTMANHCVSTRLAESKTLMIPSLDRNVEQVYNDTTLLENRLQILTKSNTHLPHDLIMQFTDLYPKEDLFILGLNTKVYSSFIHNSPTLGTTHVSVDW